MKKIKEQWVDIKGYEGLYQLSNLGKVKALQKEVNNPWGTSTIRKEKLLKIRPIGKKRYIHVKLVDNTKISYFTLHRLLALHFIPNPEGKPIINHKDSNPFNNSLDNLEWCTHSENTQHAFKNGRCEYMKQVNSMKLKLRHQQKDSTLKNYRNYATV